MNELANVRQLSFGGRREWDRAHGCQGHHPSTNHREDGKPGLLHMVALR